MKLQEFENLKLGSIVCRHAPLRREECWKVYSDYVFGPPIHVYGIQLIHKKRKEYGRIDKETCHLWDIVDPL